MSRLGSFRNRLMAGLGVMLLLFLGVALAVVTGVRSLNRVVAGELELLSGGSGLTTGMMGGVADQLRAGEAYLRTPSDSLAREFRDFGDSSHAYQQAFRRLAAATAEDQSALNRIEASQSRMEVAYARAHALVDLGRLQEAAEAAAEARGPADSLIRNLRLLAGRQQQRVATRLVAVRRVSDDRERLGWLLLVAALSVGAVTAVLLVRSIEDPLREVIVAARRLGEGDLRPAGVTNLPAELAELWRAVTAGTSRLRSMLERVGREAGAVGGTASDLSALSVEFTTSSEDIARGVAAVSAMADQRAREAQESDEVVTSLTRSSARDEASVERITLDNSRIRSLAETEAAGLTETTALLSTMRQGAQAAGGLVRRAGRQAGTVSELLDLASQLASQSEVLALNAAVEAARAGPAGQGINAIAAESRRLTETSRAAAVRIAEGITALHERIGALDRAIQQLAAQAIQAEAGGQRGAVTLGEIGRAARVVQESTGTLIAAAADRKALVDRIGAFRDRLQQEALEAAEASSAIMTGVTGREGATSDLTSSAARLLEVSERLAALVAEYQG